METMSLQYEKTNKLTAAILEALTNRQPARQEEMTAKPNEFGEKIIQTLEKIDATVTAILKHFQAVLPTGGLYLKCQFFT